jgi:hypothetical protein
MGEGGVELGWDGPRSVSPGRPADPILGSIRRPFDLADPWTIYSPNAKRHGSYHLSFAAEEQRRYGDHSGVEKVEIVD